jgi:hypothetical protein
MIEIYAKRARTKRKDLQQEVIVSEKDKLNERTSKFISLMRAMKSGWNGGPSPDIGIDKFNLTQPIPDVVIGTGDAALHELSDIVQTLRQIKTLQDTYSVARSQRAEQLKQVQPPETPNTTNTQQQVTSAVYEELYKTASNPLSRTWSRFLAFNPFSNEEGKGERIELLKSLARVDNNLQDIEDKVLGMDKSSVFDSIYLAKQLYSDAKSSFFRSFRKNIDGILVSTKKELDDLSVSAKKSLEKGTEQRGLVPKGTNPVVLNVVREMQTVVEEAIEENVENRREEQELLQNRLIPNIPETITTTDIPANVPEHVVENVPENVIEKPKRKKKKKRVPTAPIEKIPQQSDFIDSDFEKQQAEKYYQLAEYVYKNIDSLRQEGFDIYQNQLSEPWKSKIREEFNKADALAIIIVTKMKKQPPEDFDQEYAIFLRVVGIIKALSYSSGVERQAIEKDPNIIVGSMLNESEIKSQADVFSEEQFRTFKEMAALIDQKISQASTASRFIKRMITHIIPRKDKNLRLSVSRNIRKARQGLQGMMNLLEGKHLDFRNLAYMSELFLESLMDCYEGLADLGDMYNSGMRIEKSYYKQTKTRMPYDLIPSIDINAMRMIQRQLENDSSSIQKLQDIEGALSKLTNGTEDE